MRLLVIGNGLLGSTIGELAPKATVLSHADIDITSPRDVDRKLAAFEPDVVVNTAALHSLVACEDDPERARQINAIAADRLARFVPSIYVSTDYVFNDGGPHTEDLPGSTPRSAYGRSKLAGEIATLEHGGVVVRVSGLYGHYVSRAKGNKGFPDALTQSEDPIRLPTDQRFSPTYAEDAARRIVVLAAALAAGGGCFPIGNADVNMKAPTGIFHVANRGAVSWAEWGEEILAMTGHQRNILSYEAKDPIRPTDSSLKNTRLPAMPHYLQALGRWARREGRVEFVSPLRER